MYIVDRARRAGFAHRQIVSNIVWQSIAQLCARVLNLVVLILVANVLGAQGLGRVVFAVTFAQVAGVFIDFGMQPILVREAVQTEAWGLFQTFSLIKLVLALLLGAAAVAVGALVLGFRGSDLAEIALGLVAIASLSFLGLFFSLVRARQQMAYEAVFTLLHRLVYLGLAILALAVWATSGSILAAYAASGLLTAVVLFGFVVKRYRQPGRPAVRVNGKLLGQILPILVIDFWTMIYFRIDTLLLQMMRGYTEVGIYSAAYRLFEALIIVPSVLAIALFPRLVQDLAPGQGARNVRRYFAAFVLVGVAGAAALYGPSGAIVRLLYGAPEYAASVGILRLLLVAFVVVCVNYPLTQMAIASGRQKAYAVGVVAAGLVNIGLNCLAIPRYGATGAAVVTIATEISLFFFLQGQLRAPRCSSA